MDNNDLISREALKKAIKNEFDLAIHNGDIMLMSKSGIVDRVLAYIDNAPTVLYDNYSMGYQDGVNKVLSERSQGRWEPNSFQFECNLCENLNAYKSNFCPNCGADMRGVNNDKN